MCSTRGNNMLTHDCLKLPRFRWSNGATCKEWTRRCWITVTDKHTGRSKSWLTTFFTVRQPYKTEKHYTGLKNWTKPTRSFLRKFTSHCVGTWCCVDTMMLKHNVEPPWCHCAACHPIIYLNTIDSRRKADDDPLHTRMTYTELSTFLEL